MQWPWLKSMATDWTTVIDPKSYAMSNLAANPATLPHCFHAGLRRRTRAVAKEAIVSEGIDKGKLRKVCTQAGCLAHQPKQHPQTSADGAKWKAEHEKQRKEAAIANTIGSGHLLPKKYVPHLARSLWLQDHESTLETLEQQTFERFP
jgi:hypothetical protein